jgi:23S rRNA pseudouridine2604 synthase
MHISLKGLPVGDWRDLTKGEKEELYKLIEKSEPNSKKAGSTKIEKVKKEVKTAPKTAAKKTSKPGNYKTPKTSARTKNVKSYANKNRSAKRR